MDINPIENQSNADAAVLLAQIEKILSNIVELPLHERVAGYREILATLRAELEQFDPAS